jgi:endoglucanase
MDLLQVRGGKIVDSANQPVRLRGANVGGWMNMENFINGYPGSEHGIRAAMAAALGPEQGAFFFERLLDYFLAEDDIRFMRECGATAVRLPLNYRHFERDNAPFQYLEAGFARLDQALAWCAKHELYAILDLHAVQGWQNTDWHSDNAGR